MLNEDMFQQLIAFIRSEIREDGHPITRNTLLEDDLGVTGDEAGELIANFSKRFNVNIDKFIFDSYFYDEPGVFNLPNRKIKPFRISHLEKAIIAGKLDDEVINS